LVAVARCRCKGSHYSAANLPVGGNGKTPFTLFLASRMRARGLAVAIVSRGWGGTSETSALVSDGTNILMSPRMAGDEPVMMAKSFAGPIAVARRRIDAVRLLSARAHFDALILDDGFQHLRLRRDLDLILINAARGFGNGWVIPAGPLREPRSALSRADAIVLIDSGGRQTPLLTAANLALPEHLPIIHASIRPRALVRANDAGWQEYPLVLAGRRIVAVNGLADAANTLSLIIPIHTTYQKYSALYARSVSYNDNRKRPRETRTVSARRRFAIRSEARSLDGCGRRNAAVRFAHRRNAQAARPTLTGRRRPRAKLRPGGLTMAISKDLLDILACPKCKGELHLTDAQDGLVCNACKLRYPIKEDIPIMLIYEAESIGGRHFGRAHQADESCPRDSTQTRISRGSES
jgi:tetraacyldisaccharide 4'-kinase